MGALISRLKVPPMSGEEDPEAEVEGFLQHRHDHHLLLPLISSAAVPNDIDPLIQQVVSESDDDQLIYADYRAQLQRISSSGYKHKKKKQLQTVELKVRMDCDGCELKVKNALSSLTGVKSVEINRKQQKVIVTGYVEPNKVLKKAKSTGKRAEIWPYVPYSLVAQPYIAQAYDKKAPPGYVRNVDNNPSSTGTVTKYEDPYTTMFSDDNPNACSIM